ncbi:MAG: ABC transporter ATP-binding protein [Chloroflexota bacterium]
MNQSVVDTKLAVEVKELCRVYPSRGSGPDVTALDHINLQIPVGAFVAVKGKSGSGKTTLLNCLGGLDQPTSGEILVHGQSIAQMSAAQLTEWRQKEAGFIFQAFGLLPTLSAYENVELMLRIAGMPRSERRGRANEVLEMVGLGKWANQRPFEMSGGQQQRVAIARAFAPRPNLILADEATGELDTQTSHEILELMRNLVKEQGITIVLVTHDNLVDKYVDEILQLADGKLTSGSAG